MKKLGRTTTGILSRCLPILFISSLLLLSAGCDLNFKFPSFSFPKAPPKKSELLSSLSTQFSTIEGATVTMRGDDVLIYHGDMVDEGLLASTLQSVFKAFTSVSDSWDFFIEDTAYTSQGAINEMMGRIQAFTHIWDEEIGYSARVIYKGKSFDLSGEFVFQDIHAKLLSSEKLAEYYRDVYLAAHQSTIDLDGSSVTFDNAADVVSALSDYGHLLADSQALLVDEKGHLDELLEAILLKADDDQKALLDSWLSKRFIVDIPFTAITNPKEYLLSSIDVDGLRATHNLTFRDKQDGVEITSLDISQGASTFIVYMEATPIPGSTLAPISGEVVIKIGSVSIGNDSTLYTIEDAIENAGYNDIFVRYNTSFASAEVAEKVYGTTEYRIGSPTTIVLPYDNLLSSGLDDTPGDSTAGPITRSSEYVRLTVPKGITIDLKGRLVVNAKRAAYATKFQGHVTGKNYSVLNLENGSTINIKYRGELYALGFVEGEGEIEVEDGGYVYEGLFISSFRGGSATVRIEEDVFPFDQFTVMQIESPLIINKGAHYIAKALVWVSSTYHSGDFPLAGPSALIRLSNGQLEKTFDRDSGRVTFTFKGDGTIGNSGVEVGAITASTAGRAIPFDGTWHFKVSSGKTVTIDAKVALLPGSSLTVDNGAQVVVKKGSGQERGRNELTVFNNLGFSYPEDYNDYPNQTIASYYRSAPTLGYDKDSKANVLNSGIITVQQDSGIAGHITNMGSGNVILQGGAITDYHYYFVRGSAKEAVAYKRPVAYLD